jgi:hypothetical protein
MKKTFLFLIAAFLFMCCGCKSDRSMAEKAAYNYSFAMANYQLEDAAKYATAETKNTVLVRAEQLLQKLDPSYIKSDTPATIEIENLEFTSDSTAVATYHKTTPIKNFSGELELRKRDGQWYAHVTPPAESPAAQKQKQEGQRRTDTLRQIKPKF